MSLNLEISEDFITLWVRHLDESYLYIFNRESKSLWTGHLKGKTKKGRVFEPGSAEYLCNLASLKTYLADLFLLKPNDLNILEILKELNGFDNFLRLLFKLLAND